MWGGIIDNVSFPLEPSLEEEIFHDPHRQISTYIFYIYLFIYFVGYFLQEKKVGTSNMLPNIVQTKSNDSSSKDLDGQVG